MSAEQIQKACRFGDLPYVETLLEQDPCLVASVDSQLGWTPVFRAVICSQFEVARLLLTKGADPDVKTRLGDTPLHQACDNNHQRLVKLLLAHKANPNLTQNDGHTPLHYACRHGNVTIVQLLLGHKANPNVKNLELGRTPLHLAAEQGCGDAVLALLHHKASPFVKDYTDLTPADVATDEQVKTYLKNAATEAQAGADDASDSDEDEHVEFIGTISPPSFNTKLNRSFEDSTSRTDQETANYFASFAFGGKLHLNSLYIWLSKRHSESLYDPLINNGFGNLPALHQAAKDGVLTLQTLVEFGIFKGAHRRLLLANLTYEGRRSDIGVHGKFNDGLIIRPSLEDWLVALNLGQYLDQFEAAGYDELDQLIFLMNGEFRLTDKALEEEVGIRKLGHRHRVLTKLRQELLLQQKRPGFLCDSSPGCELCVVM